LGRFLSVTNIALPAFDVSTDSWLHRKAEPVAGVLPRRPRQRMAAGSDCGAGGAIVAAHGGVMRRCNYDTQLLPLAAERGAA
jgi:hypothetical protein